MKYHGVIAQRRLSLYTARRTGKAISLGALGFFFALDRTSGLGSRQGHCPYLLLEKIFLHPPREHPNRLDER
jgi:hypothetical protein